jgi:hypothetical protein
MNHSQPTTQYAIRDTQYEHPFIYVPIRHLSSFVCCLVSVVCGLWSANGPSTLVENPLQIDLFMQNKPNVKYAQINVSSFITSKYAKVDTW